MKTGIKNWIRNQLGINLLDSRTTRLEELEMFSLQDVVDNLSESMVVLAGKGQVLHDVNVVVPNNKTGLLILGDYTRIERGEFKSQKTRTTVEVIDEHSEL